MRRLILLSLCIIVPLLCLGYVMAESSRRTIEDRLMGQRYSVSDRLEQFGERARHSLIPFFRRAGVAYPPKKIALVVIKAEERLEVYSADNTRDMRFIRDYPVLAASGNLGPKLREGDLQVPEGLYRIESLNPNSRFHVSLRVNYPNDIDRRYAAMDARTRLGGDIMIHGSAVSVGCVAIGDEAIEHIFALSADVGVHNIEVLLAPVDFRKGVESIDVPGRPPWLEEVYRPLKDRLRALPRRGHSGLRSRCG